VFQSLIVFIGKYAILIIAGSLIGAFLLQFATKIIAKFKPNYLLAFKTLLIVNIIAFFLGFMIGFLASAFHIPLSSSSQILILILNFLLTAYLFGILIKDPNNESVGFQKGLLIFLLQVVFVGTLIFIIGAIFFLLMDKNH